MYFRSIKLWNENYWWVKKSGALNWKANKACDKFIPRIARRECLQPSVVIMKWWSEEKWIDCEWWSKEKRMEWIVFVAMVLCFIDSYMKSLLMDRWMGSFRIQLKTLTSLAHCAATQNNGMRNGSLRGLRVEDLGSDRIGLWDAEQMKRQSHHRFAIILLNAWSIERQLYKISNM
jgi:hypothetical protein